MPLYPQHAFTILTRNKISTGTNNISRPCANDTSVQRVKVLLKLPISDDYNKLAIYNDLKRNLKELYAGATWFQVNFQGLGTQLWSMAARLNIGSNMLLRNYRTKFRRPILQSFKSHLAPMQYQIFETRFNKDKRLLQIEEDNAPFSGANHHSWTLDGIPESGDVDMDAAGRGRLSMPAPHPLGFPEVDASRLFDSMDATMAGWSVPAGSGPPAASGGAAAALAARGPASSSGVAALPPPPPPPQASSRWAAGPPAAAAAVTAPARQDSKDHPAGF